MYLLGASFYAHQSGLSQTCSHLIMRGNPQTGKVSVTDRELANFFDISEKAVSKRISTIKTDGLLFDIMRGCGTRVTQYIPTGRAYALCQKVKKNPELYRALLLGKVDVTKIDLGHNPTLTAAVTPCKVGPPYKEKKKEKEAGAQTAPAKASVGGKIWFAPWVKTERRHLLMQLEVLLT